MPESPVLILFGPTASGKTEIIERLFTNGQFCQAEIISADSMQVYRGMDIGTAKPSPELKAAVPHHLIDIRNPDEQFNAGDFVRCANQAIFSITNCGKLPVLSGGTGFYINNFIYGLPAAPPSDNEMREKIKFELNTRGRQTLYKELNECDPVSAARIHENDEYRLIRALEVFRISAKPLSSYQSFSTSTIYPRKSIFIIGLYRSRKNIYSRIKNRCSKMMRSGLFDEVKTLYSKGYTPHNPGLKAIGYKEFFTKTQNGEYYLSENITGIEEIIAQNSRHYVKRQITYFKHIKETQWLNLDESEETIQKIIDIIKTKLSTFLEKTNGI